MAVSSYLEIFLTLFGWLMYDQIWDIIMQTGLGYLPFIGLFFKNIAGPVKSQEAKDASSTSLRRIEIDFFAMLTVIVIAVQPTLTIQYTGINYTKACSNQGAVTAGNTNTTYDTTFTQANLGGQNPSIPIWWYAVLAVSGGLTDAIVLAIPCTTDIRTTTVSLDNSRIKNPQLRKQVQQFFKDCYRDARAKFFSGNSTLPNGTPPDDIDWIGSQYFLNGVYKNQRASTEVPGFTYNANRDLEYDPRVYTPTFGKPTCYQWWTGQGHQSGIGLRDELKNQIDNNLLTSFEQLVGQATGKSQQEIDNIAIRSLVKREESTFNGMKDLSRFNDPGLANTLNSVAATVGAIEEATSFYPTLYLIKVAAPIIQAVVLMLIYTLMPFYFWLSSYDIGKVIFMSIIVFSVKFWTVLWALAHWLDNNLILALDPGWFELFKTGQNNIVIRFVIGFITGGLFVVAPLFWSGLLTWAGFKIGSQLPTSVDKAADPAGNAGSKGGNLAKDKVSGGKL